MAEQTAEELLKEIRPFSDNGEFFRAYDLAESGLARFPGNVALAHRAVLSLANAGATELAIKKFAEFGLDRSELTDVRVLMARLKKDLGFEATGVRRAERFREARVLYEAAYRAVADSSEAYYPAINAASTALFAGDEADAKLLARETLTLLERRPAGWLDVASSAPDHYWALATVIEAHLILGNLDTARPLIQKAIAAAGESYAQLTTTARQFERICAVNGADLKSLHLFEPPAVVHYLGHIISPAGRFRIDEEVRVAAEIANTLDGMCIGMAYGSLAAGADILFAEALIARKVALNIILPFRTAEFIEYSVRVGGDAWISRFQACIKAAKTVRFATEDSYLNDDLLFTYASQLAMGLAVLCARHMHAPEHQLAVWDGEARSGVAGTVVDMQNWIRAELPQTVIRCGARASNDDLRAYVKPPVTHGRRDMRAMLFADIHGFSKLADVQLPVFVSQIMGPVARVIHGFGDAVEYVNTWGDGIFAVFQDAGKAAECALQMQETLADIDLGLIGLPKHLALRIGGHLGPVYRLDEPVIGRKTSFGAHVSRAARIEPVTPEGCVYVTETFAAILSLHNGREFACDYVGVTKAHKDYGALRMFSLRRGHPYGIARVVANIEDGVLTP